MSVKMVEIGIGILRAEATEDNSVMRNWAIDSIERSTGRKFSDAERGALIKKSLLIVTTSNEQKALDAVRQQRIENFFDRVPR